MADKKKSLALATEAEISISPVENKPIPAGERILVPIQEKDAEPKQSEPLLAKEKRESAALSLPSTDAALSPSKSEFSRLSIDEEKAQAHASLLTTPPPPTTHALQTRKRQRIFDLTQRITALALSIIILGIMLKAYITYRSNKNVTAGGVSIYPTFMQLWPTYLMITAGAVTVVLNACVVVWKVRGRVRDGEREEVAGKVWDYVLHGITFAVWFASSTSFRISKDFGPAADPNVLWGYTCSSTAQQINQQYPETLRFYVQCQVQTVSFWMSISAVLVETFAVFAKVFIRK